MNKSPPVHESSYFIHQRYEDTSQLIFQQIQKKKKDLSHGKHDRPDGAINDVEFSHYGNPGIVARSEAADWLAVYNDKSLKKKEEKKKKDKSKSPKGTPEKPAKSSKSRPVVPKKYTPLPSPGQVRHNFSPEVAPPVQQVISEKKDQLVRSPNKSPQEKQEPVVTSTLIISEKKDQLVYPPNKSAQEKHEPVVTSTLIEREKKHQLVYSPDKSAQEKQEPVLTSTLIKRRDREHQQVQDGSLGRSKFVHRKDLGPTNLQSPSPEKTVFVPRSDASPQDLAEDSHSSYITRVKISSPDSSDQSSFTHASERGLFDFEAVAENLKETHFGPDVDSVPNSPVDSSSESESDDEPQGQNAPGVVLPEQKSPVNVDGGVVNFGHYGNTGVVATKEAVARSAPVPRESSNIVESKICTMM